MYSMKLVECQNPSNYCSVLRYPEKDTMRNVMHKQSVDFIIQRLMEIKLRQIYYVLRILF